MYRGDPDYFALYVGNHALGGSGLVSRLSDEVREKRGLSYSVYSYFLPMARKGPFIMGMQTRNDQLDEGLKIMWKTLRDYLDKGMTQEELVDSRKNITGGFPLRIDSNSKILEYIAMIGFYNLPLTYLDDFNKNVETPTLERIRQAMRTRLHPDKMVTVIVGGGH
jgi:zinc protease